MAKGSGSFPSAFSFGEFGVKPRDYVSAGKKMLNVLAKINTSFITAMAVGNL